MISNQKSSKKKVILKDRFFNKRTRFLSPMKHLAQKLRLWSPKNPRGVRRIAKKALSQNISRTLDKPIAKIVNIRFKKEWTKEQVSLIRKIKKKIEIVKETRYGGFFSPSVLQKRLQFETSMKFFERRPSVQKKVKIVNML